jgi:hypothetical protein
MGVVVDMQIAALAVFSPGIEPAVHIEHLVADLAIPIEILNALVDPVNGLTNPYGAAENGHDERVSGGKKVVNVFCAVEPAVQDQMEFGHVEIPGDLQEAVQSGHVAHIAGQSVEAERDLAVLTEEHGQVNLLQSLTVPVAAVLEIPIALAVGRHGGDVVVEVVPFHHSPAPFLEEGLLAVGGEASENIADPPAVEGCPVWMIMALAPGFTIAERSAPDDDVVGHDQYLPPAAFWPWFCAKSWIVGRRKPATHPSGPISNGIARPCRKSPLTTRGRSLPSEINASVPAEKSFRPSAGHYPRRYGKCRDSIRFPKSKHHIRCQELCGGTYVHEIEELFFSGVKLQLGLHVEVNIIY